MSENWIVQNLEYALNIWNEKLSETRHALEQSRRDHSALETSLSAPSFPEPTIEEILAQLKQWSDELDHADNFQTKRNLALMVIQEILLDASGEINMSLIMTKCYKWRREGDSNPRYGMTRTTV